MLASSRSLRVLQQASRRAIFHSQKVAALSTASSGKDVFQSTDNFVSRHIGTEGAGVQEMLQTVGYNSLESLIDATVPPAIRLNKELELEQPLSEIDALAKLKGIMSKNKVLKSFIGAGYYETHTPTVILRNVLENPGWYTAYTPYQAEISQGRMESLLNFQTVVTDLTKLELCGASLLDESTAAAEAMNMCINLREGRNKFFVDKNCHPQNIALVQTRGSILGIEIVVGDAESADFSSREFCGAMIQYPNTYGEVQDWTPFVDKAHASETLVVACTDLLASSLLKPVGEMNIDIAVGSAQRFGVPMGFGGPHAGFLATTKDYVRKMPGRLIGESIDSRGKRALRMALQTREQHIRREKATSNICTAQALLANMASFYAVYHGPEGLKAIASRINAMASYTASALKNNGFALNTTNFFDTFTVKVNGNAKSIAEKAEQAGVNVRVVNDSLVGISFGETINRADTEALLSAFGVQASALNTSAPAASTYPSSLNRQSTFLTHQVFNSHHSETQMLRYLKKLEDKDISLNFSMISLGSCTMKLNATSEMIPVTWPETCNIHPFAPAHQTVGYVEMIKSLNKDLATITGFAAVSAQPNSGAQGEYAGLLCIQAYQKSIGQGHRNVCLIPRSAHGTNPASASMCNMDIVIVENDAQGNVNLNDLKAKAAQYKDQLCALMITYPSTYGVYEEGIVDIVKTVHEHGGQVYMDGANMNAQVALTAPGYIGADVCHLNLHKTFCIPHGGGGPGVGAIGVARHLAPFLPGHPVVQVGGEGANVVPKSTGAVSAAPYGSAAILPISWMYIKMLGTAGLKRSTQMAILNANYMAKRLESHYKVLFRGKNGLCAHEFIIDLSTFKKNGVLAEDVAKRLMDYGFHSPTMSFPVVDTLMIEPTESEDKAELDRFCDALISIRQEIEDVISGKIKPAESPLKGAPHTMDMVFADDWTRKYSRKVAGFPAPWTNPSTKFWPTVGRVDNPYGDKHLNCSCPPVDNYEK